ncbi:MAG: DUF3343 domain-containing protein [Clostridia bacterium]|nr:DUF3343 domain-containing protein [Clostridia bacterium]
MIATVASITSANRLKKCASESGIESSIAQTPHILTKEGCGYSLRFDEINIHKIQSCAYDLNIKIRGFFKEDTSGEKTTYIKI